MRKACLNFCMHNFHNAPLDKSDECELWIVVCIVAASSQAAAVRGGMHFVMLCLRGSVSQRFYITCLSSLDSHVCSYRMNLCETHLSIPAGCNLGIPFWILGQTHFLAKCVAVVLSCLFYPTSMLSLWYILLEYWKDCKLFGIMVMIWFIDTNLLFWGGILFFFSSEWFL